MNLFHYTCPIDTLLPYIKVIINVTTAFKRLVKIPESLTSDTKFKPTILCQHCLPTKINSGVQTQSYTRLRWEATDHLAANAEEWQLTDP